MKIQLNGGTAETEQHKYYEKDDGNEVPLIVQQNIGTGHVLQHHPQRVNGILQPQPDKAKGGF